MNYDLAMMALEGLSAAKLDVRNGAAGVEIEGTAESFRHLARLCLLLGAADAKSGDAFELTAGIHASAPITLKRT